MGLRAVWQAAEGTTRAWFWATVASAVGRREARLAAGGDLFLPDECGRSAVNSRL